MMKRIFLTAVIALVLATPALLAQDRTTAPTTTVESRFQEDVRQTSSMLKETRGVVDARLMRVEKELSSASAAERASLTSAKDQLVEAQSTLEQMLGLVNTASNENWQNVRVKAQAVDETVRDMLTKLK